MAGWVVPAMAMEDDGPEPPEMKEQNPRLVADVKEDYAIKTLRFQLTHSCYLCQF